MVKGIKALGMNMEAIKGNGMIYEMNKEYIHGDGVRCRHSGYHYFDSIRDIMTLYNLNESRLFECELNGDVFDHDNIVHCTNKIKLVREINKEEIKKYIEDNLEELVNDRDWDVRREVARQGYGLDKLVNDKGWSVRREVVKQGYGLIRLSFDKDKFIKNEARTKLCLYIKEKFISLFR